jgi:hypothetical protein
MTPLNLVTMLCSGRPYINFAGIPAALQRAAKSIE